MNKIKQIRRFFNYLIKGRTKYYIHSPFVYEFCEEVLSDERYFYAFDDIDYLRYQLLSNHQEIQVTDFGAGSKQMKTDRRKISAIAKNAAVSVSMGKLLFKIIQYYKPQTILELGTSLGIATLYLAKANEKAIVHTIEGCPQTAQLAQQHFTALKSTNIHLHKGTFQEQLPKVLNQMQTLDLLYIDGHHEEKATLNYFEQCLNKANEHSIFILDDIHWSEGMESAWKQIKAHPKVQLSIDLFRMGLVFFKKDKVKEDFTLYYFK